MMKGMTTLIKELVSLKWKRKKVSYFFFFGLLNYYCTHFYKTFVLRKNTGNK